MLRRNVGGIDRVLRLTLGAVLVVAGVLLLTAKARLGVTLAVVGLIVLVTGIVRYCGLYVPFGISTAGPEGRQEKPVCCGMTMREMASRFCASQPPAPAEKEHGELAMTAGKKR